MSTRTYYRGTDAVVTDERFVWLTSPAKMFVVRDLHNVGLVRRNAGLHRYTASAAGVTLILAAAAWTTFDHPIAYALGIVGIAIPGAAAAISWRVAPRRWELHATYRGREVIIYASADERVFNQVSRALRRSMEAARSPARRLGLAAA
jgi:hypothetical protein